MVTLEATKVCTKCKGRKMAGEFSARGSRRHTQCKSCRRNPGSLSIEMVPSGPFVQWLREVVDRDMTTLINLSGRFDIPEKTLRRIMSEQVSVNLATVERALVAEGTHLREVYPSLYMEAA